jgi:beta-hydroxylase
MTGIKAIIDQMEADIAAGPNGQVRFFEPESFPWVREVELSWPAIRKEADRLLTAVDKLPGFEEIQVEQEVLTTDRRWKVFPFQAYGHQIVQNERRCPETCKALQKIPGMKAALFSILQAGKELPPHRGPYKGVLRYHLGIKIPRPESQCGIVVDGELARWKESKSLIFDDTHLHEAWNHSKEDRVVLFVDFERPLPVRLAALNSTIIDQIGQSDFATASTKNWETWEERYGRELDESIAVSDQ